MISKWLHNRKHKQNPLCVCKWRMLPVEYKYHDYIWKCKWGKCGWETFDNGDGKLHWYKKG